MRAATGQSEPDIGLSQLQELEERMKRFRIESSSNSPDIVIEGNAYQGYAVNTPSCEGGATSVGTVTCCFNDGTCDDTLSAGACLSAGGTIFSGGCDPNPCVGVCCEPGCVDDSTPDSCAADGGTWQGFGTTCADDPPPCPTGACCVGEDCTITTQSGCDDLGGAFQGSGTTCDPNPCTVCPCISFTIDATLTMSCTFEGPVTCHGSGTIDWFSDTECEYRGGFNAHDCMDLPVQVDLKFTGGEWHILIQLTATDVCDCEIPLEPPFPNVFCTGWDGMACHFIDLVAGASPDGSYSIDLDNEGTDCPDTCHIDFTIATHSGACCDPFDACTQTNESCCTDAGGTFQGYDTSCDPNPCVEATGACCTLGGDCDITTETLCGIIGGTYLGDGTTCSPFPCGGEGFSPPP